MKACQSVMPGKPMVVVFDTAFHQTIPKERYIYPIPYEYYKNMEYVNMDFMVHHICMYQTDWLKLKINQ